MRSRCWDASEFLKTVVDAHLEARPFLQVWNHVVAGTVYLITCSFTSNSPPLSAGRVVGKTSVIKMVLGLLIIYLLTISHMSHEILLILTQISK